MPLDLLIRSGTVVHEDRVARADIAIEEGKIVEIGPEVLRATRETIDAAGLHIFPGVIDPHVHFNEPGRAEWEGFSTGSAALAAGGGTLFFDMPLNSSPPVLDGASFDLKLEAAKRSSLTDFALWGGLTPKNLDRMDELAARGVVGFKAFMCESGIDDFPHADDRTLLDGMKQAARLGLPVAVHAEDDEITRTLTARAREAGKTSVTDYLLTRPTVAEDYAIFQAVRLAADAGCRLHVVHVSSPFSLLGLATAAKRYNCDVSCETCPHYLSLSDEDMRRMGALAKCAPPLRSDVERKYFWDHLTDERLICIASDHSPAPPAMKSATNFFDAWGGIAGIQSTLPILLSHRPAVGLPHVSRLTSSNVAKRFSIAHKGRLEVGFDADLTLVDLNRASELSREKLLDRHRLSPYVGWTFLCSIRRTILRGQVIFLDGKTVGGPRGRLVVPARR